MTIAGLLRDGDVVSPKLTKADRDLTVDYVLRRARVLIKKDPAALEDPTNKGDLTIAGTAAVKTKLVAEIPVVRAVQAKIRKLVVADAAHLDLSSSKLGRRGTTRLATDPRVLRGQLLDSMVTALVAVDDTLADPANIDRLHTLCDRRLRTVERMMYDLGRAEDSRAWRPSQIEANRGGPWLDGLERIVEYPRVTQASFLKACRPGADGKCATRMGNWAVQGSEHLVGPIQSNPGTTVNWVHDQGDDFTLLYHKIDPPRLGPLDAITGLFAPSTDYLGRDLLFCDQAIHALHLEALAFSRRKQPADWLDKELVNKPAGWLRLEASFDDSDRFLAGRAEPAHFEFATVSEVELLPGDHLIVYNHPAYQHATVAGAWKLENALVVTAYPLRLQGTGPTCPPRT